MENKVLIPQRIYYGAAYYPEVWKEENIEYDILKMKQLHMNIVRMGEFAWTLFEPEEGKFHFEWLHKIIDRLSEEGIDIILGTPTATPPAWLATKHPEIFCMDEDGVRKTHGARRNCEYTCSIYQHYSSIIVEKLAKEFGKKKGVIAWQIDNEFQLNHSYSNDAKTKWQGWLIGKYKNIKELNEAWGTLLWSQKYNDFTQVPMGSKRIWQNPSLLSNWDHFHNDMIASFLSMQVKIIRKYSEIPITHNTMPEQKVDYPLLAKELDFLGIDCYHDYEYYWLIASNYDRMRTYNKGNYFLLETAPNYSAGHQSYFLHPYKGGIRAALWMNHALGGQASMFWLWRQPAFGHEMGHGSIVNSWGKPVTNFEELCTIGKELQECADFLLNNPVEQARVGIFYSHEAQIGLDIEPYICDTKNYYLEWSKRFYKPLQDIHIHRDVISELINLEEYNVLFVPMMPYISEDIRLALKEWVYKGGSLILGPMSGYRTKDWAAYTNYALGDFEEWIGIQVDSRVPFGTRPSLSEPVKLRWEDNLENEVTLWGDILSSDDGVTLCRYKNGIADLSAAVIQNQVGNGKVVLLGTDPGEERLKKIILELCKEKGIKPLVTGDGGVISAPRKDNGLILVNITNEVEEIIVNGKGRDLLSGSFKEGKIQLQPYEVLVLEMSKENS